MRKDQTVEELAYHLWVARGRPHGSAELDWQEAERQIGSHESPTPTALPVESSGELDDSLKATFPASDPPANHLPDRPPANADAKWKAAGKARTAGAPKAATKTAGAPKTPGVPKTPGAPKTPVATSAPATPRKRSPTPKNSKGSDKTSDA